MENFYFFNEHQNQFVCILILLLLDFSREGRRIFPSHAHFPRTGRRGGGVCALGWGGGESKIRNDGEGREERERRARRRLRGVTVRSRTKQADLMCGRVSSATVELNSKHLYQWMLDNHPGRSETLPQYTFTYVKHISLFKLTWNVWAEKNGM